MGQINLFGYDEDYQSLINIAPPELIDLLDEMYQNSYRVKHYINRYGVQWSVISAEIFQIRLLENRIDEHKREIDGLVDKLFPCTSVRDGIARKLIY